MVKLLEQSERGSDWMPALTWELWLARQVVADKPLPWQKAPTLLTPGRVRQNFGSVLAQIGTPTRAPQPRGKSKGWPKGKVRTCAERHPIVKKSKN